MRTGLFRRMDGAWAPFHNVHISATVSYDSHAIERLWKQDDERRGGRSTTIRFGDVKDISEAGGDWGRYFWRVWWEPPSRYRDELTRPGIPTDVAIVRDDVRMIYVAGERTLYTSELPSNASRWKLVAAPPGTVALPTVRNRFSQFPLIDPPLPEDSWQFTTVAEGEKHDGRVTRRVRVTRLAGDPRSVERPHPGYNMPLVDEYECVVDDERQIILRFSAISEGVPIAVVTADEVQVNTPFPADIFNFTPPDGSRLIHVERLGE